MNKITTLIIFLFLPASFSQTLVETINLPNGTFWDQGYGLVYENGKYWISSGSSTAGEGLFYAVDQTGVLTDTVNINYPSMQQSQGLAFDGTNFWYVERKTARCDLFKVSPDGNVLDSILTPNLGGSWYLGGAAWDGTGLWVSVYYPNDIAALYKIDVNSKNITDTIDVAGTQPTGITVKGDTLFYVMDGFENDDEIIYAIDLNTKSILFSWHVPEQPGLRQNPRGLAWDGSYFYLLAEPVGASSGRQLFKYDLSGSGTPQILLSSDLLVFPQTAVGNTSSQNLAINNIGTATLVIDSVSIDEVVFTTDTSLFPLAISPSGSEIIQIDFSPTAFNYYYGVMTLFSNDIVSPAVEVNLEGQGVLNGPVINLTDDFHDFGEVWIANEGTARWEFGIFNTGDENLEIQNLEFNLPQFVVISQPLPVTISPTDTVNFTIAFTPTAAQSYEDTLFITSNDPSSPVSQLIVTGTGALNSYTIGFEFWNYQVPDNPNAGSFQDYRVEALKTMNDITGDGIREVVIATDNYWTMALDGAASGVNDTLWTFNSYINNSNAGSIGGTFDFGVQDALSVASDLNSDGYNDIVIGTGGGNEHVYAIDGTNGQILWQFGDDINFALGDFEAVDAKHDFNADGTPDVLAIADGNEQGTGYHRAYLFNGVNGDIIWSYYYPGPFLAFGKTIISVEDISGDGLPDAVIAVGNNGTTDLKVHALDGTNGAHLWEFEATDYEPKELLELPVPGESPDIIACEYFGWVYRLDGETGNQVWSYFLGNLAGVIQMNLLPDINNDGIDEVLIAAFTGGVTCLDGGDGSVLWTYPMNYQYGVAPVPDLNNDGYDDVITGDQDGVFYCINGSGSPLLFSHSFPGDRINTVNTIASIDGNPSYELLVGTLEGKVVCFSGGLNAVPVELTSFTAEVNKSDVTLTWTTGSELNNSGFSIERKYENSDFEEIRFIPGKGTTNEITRYVYTDKNLKPGIVQYRLKQVDMDGTINLSDIVEVEIGKPDKFELFQNYPNPFNPVTSIKFSIPEKSFVTLKIYNAIGKEIKVLLDEEKPAGNYEIKFNGSDLASGVYFYRLTAGDFSGTKKLILLK
ncbi:MAG: hypothetical protein Kow0098_18440 [Ignavibacteriaceae bacterium]